MNKNQEKIIKQKNKNRKKYERKKANNKKRNNIKLEQKEGKYRLTIPASCNNKEFLNNVGISMNVSFNPSFNTEGINLDMNSLFNVKVIDTA